VLCELKNRCVKSSGRGFGVRLPHDSNRSASWRRARRRQPYGSDGTSRSEYLLEADPLRFIRLIPGHKSGQVTDAYTHASQKNLQEIRIPFDELQKNYIYLFQMKFFYYCIEW